jgi:hypothetical protein
MLAAASRRRGVQREEGATMNYGDDPGLDKLVADGAATFGARWKPCHLCGHIDSDYGVAPIVISQRVYCHRCWFNRRELISNA